MWICMEVNNQTCGTGNTPTEAFEDHNNYHDDTNFEYCEFYKVDDPIEMKQTIILQEVIVPSTQRSKK